MCKLTNFLVDFDEIKQVWNLRNWLAAYAVGPFYYAEFAWKHAIVFTYKDKVVFGGLSLFTKRIWEMHY